jgi:hypothetical protein
MDESERILAFTSEDTYARKEVPQQLDVLSAK